MLTIPKYLYKYSPFTWDEAMMFVGNSFNLWVIIGQRMLLTNTNFGSLSTFALFLDIAWIIIMTKKYEVLNPFQPNPHLNGQDADRNNQRVAGQAFNINNLGRQGERQNQLMNPNNQAIDDMNNNLQNQTKVYKSRLATAGLLMVASFLTFFTNENTEFSACALVVLPLLYRVHDCYRMKDAVFPKVFIYGPKLVQIWIFVKMVDNNDYDPILPKQPGIAAFVTNLSILFYTTLTLQWLWKPTLVFNDKPRTAEDAQNALRPVLRTFEEAAEHEGGHACSICLVDFHEDDQILETPSGHFYHKSCLEKWLEIKQTCPVSGAICLPPNESTLDGSGGPLTRIEDQINDVIVTQEDSEGAEIAVNDETF